MYQNTEHINGTVHLSKQVWLVKRRNPCNLYTDKHSTGGDKRPQMNAVLTMLAGSILRR